MFRIIKHNYIHEDLNNIKDSFYMHRCLNLAQKGLGETYPNPMVGCVIVHKDEIIGEGWHHAAGSPHAEVNAISSVKNKHLLKESTLYVSLEPCSHFGKTPPCANLIIKNKIPRVIIASKDPNPIVRGKGIAKLQNMGCEVYQGVLEKEADFLNRRFFTFHQKKRPYIVLKWAQTEDHFISPENNQKNSSEIFWITNTISRQKVHQWRSEEAAILIGVQTAIDDNPKLTTRNWKGNNPLRLILDPNNRISKTTHLQRDTNSCLFFNLQLNNLDNDIKKSIVLKPYSLINLLKYCYKIKIQSIIVEGGKKTIQSFIDENLWDESRVFTNPKKMYKGIKAPTLNKKVSFEEMIDKDELKYYFR
jgi:diaminohydroxyphosphoribosylaminopyrimidine deaminase/5-amino-6-(5-phosphoribosylamino)uracil reductase